MRDRSNDDRIRGPIVLVAGATSNNKKRLRGPGTRLAKRIPKETRQNGPMGQETMTAITSSKHDKGTPPRETIQTELQRQATKPGLRMKAESERKVKAKVTQVASRTQPGNRTIEA